MAALASACRCVAILASILVLVRPATAHAQAASLEYAIKATYLYKFGPFVEWPSAAFPAPTATLTLCVVGNDPFGDILDRAVVGQQVGERPIAVRRLPSADGDGGCHVMYIGGSADQTAAQALAAVRGRPVLTVTDSAQDADARGIVHFVRRDNRVRFQIDTRSAAENGIVISSKLLSLAVSVTPRP